MPPNGATAEPRATIAPLIAADHGDWTPLRRGGLDVYRAEIDAATARRSGSPTAVRAHWLTHESKHDAMRLDDKVAEPSGFVQDRNRLR